MWEKPSVIVGCHSSYEVEVPRNGRTGRETSNLAFLLYDRMRINQAKAGTSYDGTARFLLLFPVFVIVHVTKCTFYFSGMILSWEPYRLSTKQLSTTLWQEEGYTHPAMP